MDILPAFVRRRIERKPQLLKIGENIGWLFFDKILRIGVGLLVGVWIARYLGPEQFGLFNFAIAFVGLFGAVAGLGLQSIVVRNIARDPAEREETLGTAAALQVIGGLAGYGLSLGTIYLLRPSDHTTTALVAILGSMMLFKAGEVGVYWFESQVQSKYTVMVRNGAFLFFAGIKIALIFNKAPLLGFAWATAAEALVVALLMFFMLSLRGPKLRDLRVKLTRAKTLLEHSWPLLMSGVAIMIYMRTDQIMLGELAGDTAVGVYSAATRISEVLYSIPIMIMASVFPAILQVKKSSEERYYERLQQMFDLMVVIAVGIALPMTFLSAPLVIFLFGEAFSSSGAVLSIHVWTAVFVFLGVASGNWFIAENRQILSFKRTVVGAVVNVVLNYQLIPVHGAIGAAIATVISQATAAWLFDGLHPVTRRIFLMKCMSMNPIRLGGRFFWKR